MGHLGHLVSTPARYWIESTELLHREARVKGSGSPLPNQSNPSALDSYKKGVDMNRCLPPILVFNMRMRQHVYWGRMT